MMVVIPTTHTTPAAVVKPVPILLLWWRLLLLLLLFVSLYDRLQPLRSTGRGWLLLLLQGGGCRGNSQGVDWSHRRRVVMHVAVVVVVVVAVVVVAVAAGAPPAASSSSSSSLQRIDRRVDGLVVLLHTSSTQHNTGKNRGHVMVTPKGGHHANGLVILLYTYIAHQIKSEQHWEDDVTIDPGQGSGQGVIPLHLRRYPTSPYPSSTPTPPPAPRTCSCPWVARKLCRSCAACWGTPSFCSLGGGSGWVGSG